MGKTITGKQIDEQLRKNREEAIKRGPSDGAKKLIAVLGAKPQSKLRDYVITQLMNLYYDDFASPLPAPKVQLAHDLRMLGPEFADVRFNMIQGHYDD